MESLFNKCYKIKYLNIKNLIIRNDCNSKWMFDMINPNRKAIQGFSVDYGPNFGDYDLGLKNSLKEGMTYANSSCNYLSNNKLELTGGNGDNDTFQTEEFEVYQVIY